MQPNLFSSQVKREAIIKNTIKNSAPSKRPRNEPRKASAVRENSSSALGEPPRRGPRPLRRRQRVAANENEGSVPSERGNLGAEGVKGAREAQEVEDEAQESKKGEIQVKEDNLLINLIFYLSTLNNKDL